MIKEIERNTGVPVVSIIYDGTCSPKNNAVIPYLKYPRKPRDIPAAEHFESAPDLGSAKAPVG
jgi:hypothetical protein